MTATRIRETATWWSTALNQPRRLWVRQVTFQIHLWVGLLVGLLATVVGLSGSAVVYREALARAISPSLFRTASGPSLPADPLLLRAREAAPACTVQDLDITGPQAPWVFRIVCPGDQRRFLYVDPHTGKVLGIRGDREGVVNWLDSLHTELLAGERGQYVNGIGGALLFVLCATGIVLWWPGRGRVRRAIRMHWRARPRRVNYDVHTVGGFWIVLPLALEAFTGTFLCFGIAYMLPLFGGHKGDFDNLFASAPVPVRQQHASLAAMLEAARKLRPEAQEYLIQIPSIPTQALTIATRSPKQTSLGLVSILAFDPYSGMVTKSVRSEEISSPLRIVLFLDALHFGLIGGNMTKALWVLLGFTPGVLFVSGLLMWLRRIAPSRSLTHPSATLASGDQV